MTYDRRRSRCRQLGTGAIATTPECRPKLARGPAGNQRSRLAVTEMSRIHGRDPVRSYAAVGNPENKGIESRIGGEDLCLANGSEGVIVVWWQIMWAGAPS
jgi:hypothetical protein